MGALTGAHCLLWPGHARILPRVPSNRRLRSLLAIKPNVCEGRCLESAVTVAVVVARRRIVISGTGAVIAGAIPVIIVVVAVADQGSDERRDLLHDVP